MRNIGIGYHSKEISDLLQAETPALGELIGLNFSLRSPDERKGAIRLNGNHIYEGFEVIPPNNSFIIDRVYFKVLTESPRSYAFYFDRVDDNESPQVIRAYNDHLVSSLDPIPPEESMSVALDLGGVPIPGPMIRLVPEQVPGTFQYFNEEVEFHFVFFSRIHLKLLTALGPEIIFSGSKMTFGLLSPGMQQFVDEGFETLEPIFTLKAESNMGYYEETGASNNSSSRSMTGSFIGQPCPYLWIPDIVWQGIENPSPVDIQNIEHAWQEAIMKLFT